MRVTHGWVIVGVGALDPLLRIPEAGHLPRVERPEGELESSVARKRRCSSGSADAQLRRRVSLVFNQHGIAELVSAVAARHCEP